MRAGGLRQRLLLQALIGALSDGMGGTIGGRWMTIATVWALVDPLSGTERLQGLQLTAAITHRVTMRYRSGVTPKMRLVRPVGGQAFEIHAVLNVDQRNRQLELLCSELQTVGA